MKRFICLFLILWLPLFTGTAFAMSTQMQAAEAQQAAHQAPHPACHNMQSADSQHQPATPCKHCTGHCFACGICAFGCNIVGFMTVSYTFVSTPASLSPNLVGLVFSSQLYPPALKPPIVA